MDNEAFVRYTGNLVNLFFKILPLRENEEPTLVEYIRSLQVELMGCIGFIVTIEHDPAIISLLAILQYLLERPDADVRVYKREVFKAISICNKLRAKYARSGNREG